MVLWGHACRWGVDKSSVGTSQDQNQDECQDARTSARTRQGTISRKLICMLRSYVRTHTLQCMHTLQSVQEVCERGKPPRTVAPAHRRVPQHHELLCRVRSVQASFSQSISMPAYRLRTDGHTYYVRTCVRTYVCILLQCFCTVVVVLCNSRCVRTSVGPIVHKALYLDMLNCSTYLRTYIYFCRIVRTVLR